MRVNSDFNTKKQQTIHFITDFSKEEEWVGNDHKLQTKTIFCTFEATSKLHMIVKVNAEYPSTQYQTQSTFI